MPRCLWSSNSAREDGAFLLTRGLRFTLLSVNPSAKTPRHFPTLISQVATSPNGLRSLQADAPQYSSSQVRPNGCSYKNSWSKRQRLPWYLDFGSVAPLQNFSVYSERKPTPTTTAFRTSANQMHLNSKYKMALCHGSHGPSTLISQCPLHNNTLEPTAASALLFLAVPSSLRSEAAARRERWDL